MSRLFISHSSQNNPEAAALNLWLKEQGWDDVFLDVTPDRGSSRSRCTPREQSPTDLDAGRIS